MNRLPAWARVVPLAICFAALVACSKEPSTQQSPPPAQPAQPAPPAQTAPQSAQPSAQPAAAPAPAPSAAPAGTPSGPQATEKHYLKLANYSGTAVTISLNGNWIGQWDSHAEAPLDSVVQGKDNLTVELADQPNNTVTVEVFAQREGQYVNLLRLNFAGKAKGTYNYSFVAR